MIRILFLGVVAVHGLIHCMGFIKAIRPEKIPQMAQHIARPAGLLWLSAALLFACTAALFLLRKDWWWMAAVPALVLSQPLIIMSWKDAKFGTIANVLICAAAVVAYGNWRFSSMTARELALLVPDPAERPVIVTDDMLGGLPPVVRRWLVRSNVSGKVMTRIVHLAQSGRMRNSPDGKWVNVEAEQWFNAEQPGFIWRADVLMAPGVFLAGRDRYLNGKGQMLIKLLSLIPVAESSGPEADQGTLLRYLAEIVWFPSAALRNYIRWRQVDMTTAEATMTYGGVTASGVFTFDANGDMTKFEAKRYYYRPEGSTLEDWMIQVEPNGYREFEGVRVAARASATWRLKEGDFTWYRLDVTDIRYNEAAR